jgi:hypothetical protein
MDNRHLRDDGNFPPMMEHIIVAWKRAIFLLTIPITLDWAMILLPHQWV